jgi:hypothetical protein
VQFLGVAEFGEVPFVIVEQFVALGHSVLLPDHGWVSGQNRRYWSAVLPLE